MANRNRAAAEAVILKRMGQASPNGPTVGIYRDHVFPRMSDEDFHSLMMRLKNKEVRLPIICPNFGKGGESIERAKALAEEMGHDFYQYIWIYPNDGKTPAYRTNKKFPVLDLPWRRQSQVQKKKVSIPRHNQSIDELTGQPAGESKGSAISSSELQVMSSLELGEMITEMIKYRGGDVKGFAAMNDMIDKTGEVSMEAIKHLAGGVESTKTLATYFNCMHLSNTLST
jgi:hypothetical protein